MTPLEAEQMLREWAETWQLNGAEAAALVLLEDRKYLEQQLHDALWERLNAYRRMLRLEAIAVLYIHSLRAPEAEK
jgi:histidinol-phosphate/aromatic aminotransferase/cobyric acid decarboxylase-like protein